MHHFLQEATTILTSLIVLLTTVVAVQAQCPWQREITDLQTSCICAYNLGQELSVQCDQVFLQSSYKINNIYTKFSIFCFNNLPISGRIYYTFERFK